MTTIEQQKHFDISQVVERESLKNIFLKFLQYRKCSNLVLTSEHSYEKVDCFFISAQTQTNTQTIVAEMKKRNISLTKYNTSFIEFEKFKNLYSWHKAGNTCFYIIEYNDAILLFNISDLFFKNEAQYYDNNIIGLETYFVEVKATATMADYQRGQKEKLFRNIQYKDAQFILDKNYQPKNYNYIIDLFNDNEQRKSNADDQAN